MSDEGKLIAIPTEEVNAEKERLISTYYSSDIWAGVNDAGYLGMTSGYLAGIAPETQYTLDWLYKEVPQRNIEEEYWHKHHESYCTRLDQLLESVTEEEEERILSADAIIAIPVRNEKDLIPALKAIKKASKLRGECIKPIVMIYHNFTDEVAISEESLRALTITREKYGAIIVAEEVSEENVLQDAKKVCLDLALRLKPTGIDLPIIQLDADIVDLSNGLLIKSIKALNEGVTPLRLVSAEYKYDRRLLRKFPALHHYLKVLGVGNARIFREEGKKKEEVEIAGSEEKCLGFYAKGGFTVASAKTFMLLGGIFPVNYIFEDVALSEQIVGVCNVLGIDDFPIIDMAETGESVNIDPGREVAQVLESLTASPTERWHGIVGVKGSDYAQVQRVDWKRLKLGQDAPALLSIFQDRMKLDMMKTVLRELIIREVGLGVDGDIGISRIGSNFIYYCYYLDNISTKRLAHILLDCVEELELDHTLIGGSIVALRMKAVEKGNDELGFTLKELEALFRQGSAS